MNAIVVYKPLSVNTDCGVYIIREKLDPCVFIFFVANPTMFVSVLTVTYNRSRFFPGLIQRYLAQDYPLSAMEWLILDDGAKEEQAATKQLLESAGIPNLRYMSATEQKPMGQKLNLLTSLSKGDVIVIMDDDDIYPPTRVSGAVTAFCANPHIHIAGCSKVYMHFLEDDAVYVAGPYHDRHALHCTMAYRRSYLADHRYDDDEVCAVERVFTNNFTEPMIQLPSRKTILHIVHSANTFQQKRSVGGLRKTAYRPDTVVSISPVR
jgi:glycosyltransferase involved in cell wall biosynthesis